MDLPTSPLYSLSKNLHEFGRILVMDDKSDIGYFEYYDRDSHYYHGKHSPHHPSPWHHWQVGGAFMLVGQLLGTIAALKEVQQEEEGEEREEPASFSTVLAGIE